MIDLEDEFMVGSIITFKDLTDEQRELFIKLVGEEFSPVLRVLFSILEDDYLTLEIIDILAGNKVQFPTRKKLYKLLEKVKIYSFVKSKDYSSDSYKLLAKQYKKRISQIRSTVERVDHLTNINKEESENENH